MRHSFSFAVTLHRVFDSAPPEAEASFSSENRQLAPIRKPNGLYVFLHDAENPVTVDCKGFLYTEIAAEHGKVTPALLYPGRIFAAPPGWRLVHGNGKPGSLVYLIDGRYELNLTEYNAGQSFARIRSRKGFTGGCLVFELNGEKEIALILEKQAPDMFYISKLVRDYSNGSVRRCYVAITDGTGEFYICVPEDFIFEPNDYKYL